MRLDVYLVENGLTPSREKAGLALERSLVFVNDKLVKKAAYQVKENDIVTLAKPPLNYVSLGGEKLETAFHHFQFEVKGRHTADLGSSTGGFTDFLLQHGALSVLSVDVGKNQLHPSLRSKKEVILLEETDIRDLHSMDLKHEKISLIVMDLSFISITKVLYHITAWIKESPFFEPYIEMIALVKPQFETALRSRARGGIIRNDQIRAKAVEEVKTCALQHKWEYLGSVPTEADRKTKNLEYLMYLQLDKSRL